MAAVNISCGYYNAHTCHEYVNIVQMEDNIERAKKLLLKPSEKYKYIEKVYYRPPISTTYHGTGNYGSGYYTTEYNPKYKSYGDSYSSDMYSYYTKGLMKYDFPEPPFDFDNIIEYGLGILHFKEYCQLKDSEDKIWTPSTDCIVDESGTVYLYHDEMCLYYPLISDIHIVDCDGNPIEYEPIDEEEFSFAYLSNIKKMSEYADSLAEYDFKNGTDFESDFYEELYSITLENRKYL